jgi:hypothetical protein
MTYDAWGGSWGTSWGTSWTRSGITPPAAPPVVGGYWEDESKRKRKEHQPNPDRAALRALLESAFQGRRSEPIREVIAEHALPSSAPPQPFGVDWDALLEDVDAQLKVLAAYQERLARNRRESRQAEVAAMQAQLEARRQSARRLRRTRMRRVAVRMILARPR